jgi:hypothetical protein
MNDQEQQTIISSENLPTLSNDENPSLENIEKIKEDESNSSEQCSTRRLTIPQDIRYSNEQNNDREKLVEKYNNYQISDTNACNIRFLIDNRQKKSLLGRKEGIDNREKHHFLSFFLKTKIRIYIHLERNSASTCL